MDDNHDRRNRWIDLHWHFYDHEENNGENVDAESDSDESNFNDDNDVMSDDSGFGSNYAEEDNVEELTDDSESEDELIGDLHENVESAYVVIGEVQGLPEALLLQQTSWRAFERQIINEIRSRHYNWELNIIFERQLLVEILALGYWCQHIFRLQARVPNLVPNFRLLNAAGVPQFVCKMSGTIQIRVSEIGSFYKIILRVEHRGNFSAVI